MRYFQRLEIDAPADGMAVAAGVPLLVRGRAGGGAADLEHCILMNASRAVSISHATAAMRQCVIARCGDGGPEIA